MSERKESQRNDVPRKFFSEDEQRRLREAIAAAEARTSGEIRLHLERDVPKKAPVSGDPYLRAREVFEKLGMHQTAERNGVLVYLATRTHRFAVLGDEQLHQHVGEAFWPEIRDLMAGHFKEDRFVEGLSAGIALIGEKLRDHFPHRDDDVNELSDEISY
jgi:uncharacterized membrane protein